MHAGAWRLNWVHASCNNAQMPSMQVAFGSGGPCLPNDDIILIPWIFCMWHPSLVDSLTISTCSNLQESHRLVGRSSMPKHKRTLQSSPLEFSCPQATVKLGVVILVMPPKWPFL